MTDAPPGRRLPRRAIAHGFVLGLGIGLAVAAAGQLVAFALFLAQGASGSYVPYLRIGAAYVEMFHHVGVEIRALPVGGGSALSVAVGIALMSVLAAAVVVLSLAGRRLTPGSAAAAAATVPAVALGYAIVPLAMSFVAEGNARAPGVIAAAASLEIRVSTWAALIVPFAIACVAVTIGALSASAGAGSPSRSSSVPSSGRSPGGSADELVAGVVAGGVRAFALGVLLSAAGGLVLASVQPAVADAYAAVIGAPGSTRGRIVAGGHAALLLPNQAIWLLVPALGACDEVVVDVRRTPLLCYWRMPARLSVAVTGTTTPIGAAQGFRRPSVGYLAFLLVPLAATVAGGVRAGREARSTRAAMVAGATSGVLFAGLVAGGIVLARIDLLATGALLGASVVKLEAGPEFVRGTMLAAVWGIFGGAAGGAVSRRVGAAASRYVGGGAMTE